MFNFFPFFLDVINTVSRGVLGSHVGFCNLGVTLGVETPLRKDVTSIVQINFVYFYFYFFFNFIFSFLFIFSFMFLNLNIYLKCAC